MLLAWIIQGSNVIAGERSFCHMDKHLVILVPLKKEKVNVETSWWNRSPWPVSQPCQQSCNTFQQCENVKCLISLGLSDEYSIMCAGQHRNSCVLCQYVSEEVFTALETPLPHFFYPGAGSTIRRPWPGHAVVDQPRGGGPSFCAPSSPQWNQI